MTDVLSSHAGVLSMPGRVAAVQLLDARLTHPHRPESPLCRGWGTYRVTTSDASTVELYVKGFPKGGAEAAWRQDRAARPDGRATLLPDVDLVVWQFPEDPVLTELPTLVDPRRVSGILPPVVHDALGSDRDVRTTVVRYQPEASATLRLETGRNGTSAVYAKLLSNGSVAEVGARHGALWSMTDSRDETVALRVAEPLAADPGHGVLWTRAVPGLPLASAVTTADLAETAASLGGLLAALHGSRVEVAQRVTADDLLAEARKKAAKLVRAHPPVGPTVSALVTAATQRRDDVVRELECPLHGDFHLDQLVGSPDGPVLVDLDSMVLGAPEVDLAEFLVDLALRGLPDQVCLDVARRLLASYTSAARRDLDPALLSVSADAEFLNRCYRHLRGRLPGWQAALERELGRHAAARALLQP